MLVLSRKVNEKIRLGKDIEITIVAISGDQVRIGIQAPKDLRILRSEILEEIEKQNLAAVALPQAQNEETASKLRQLFRNKISEK
jgi:carbon storage regulator